MIKLFRLSTLVNQVRYSSSAAQKEAFDLYAGVLLERLPIVSKKFNEIEESVMKMLQRVEFESSLKSDHEIKKEKDKRQQESIKAGGDTHDDGKRVLQTAQDFEDNSSDELSKFTFAARQSEDENNSKSLSRKLDETLIFLCSHKLGNESVNLLPQGKWKEGETLRQTAERVLQEACGSDLKAHFYGNAPIGFYKYKYPVAERKETVGAKVFFFRAIYKVGDVKNDKLKYEWISHQEMPNKLKSSYHETVKTFCCN